MTVASARLKIGFGSWRLVLAVNMASSRYGDNRKIAQTTLRCSRCVVSKFGFRSFNILGHYPICSPILPSFLCNSTYPILQSKAFVSREYHSSFFCRANIGGEICFYCKFRETINYFSVHFPRSCACHLHRLAGSRDVMWQTLGTNRSSKLHNLMNGRSSVWYVVFFKWSVSWKVWLAPTGRPGRITWLGESILFVNNAHFFNIELRPFLKKAENT